MTSNASTPEEYINELPEERKEVISKLRDAINKNLPKGFEEGMGWHVKLSHSTFDLSGRLSLYTRITITFYEFSFTKEFCGSISYGNVRQK
jgi:hypothetical protein